MKIAYLAALALVALAPAAHAQYRGGPQINLSPAPHVGPTMPYHAPTPLALPSQPAPAQTWMNMGAGMYSNPRAGVTCLDLGDGIVLCR